MRNRLVTFGLAAGIAVGVGVGALIARPSTPGDPSPHGQALRLVLESQADTIRAVDQGDWWLDTKERSWSVKRPFGPGYVDSTHFFDVTYRIDGRVVASWSVDTRTGKVSEAQSAK